jgi:hypothetical protein
MTICKLDENKYCERHRTQHLARNYELSQMDNELGEKYRQLWDKQMDPNYKPDARTQAANFSKATIEHILAGRPKVSEEMYQTRLSICNDCELCDKTEGEASWRCKACGCYLKEGYIMPGKARWADQDCPHPQGSRWPKIQLPLANFKNSPCPACPGRG